jgi:predicted MFS family arabinose efflux permease
MDRRTFLQSSAAHCCVIFVALGAAIGGMPVDHSGIGAVFLAGSI